MNKNKLFLASCMALVVTAMAFGLRASMLNQWQVDFGLTVAELGWISGTAFWGFTLAMIFGGPLCDIIGMKRIVYIAFFGHLLGTILTIFSSGFWSLFISTLLIGIGNGMVEAACNPLIATIYSEQKTKMLNRFHVWFPGGIVIGGLIGYFLSNMGVNWQIQLIAMLIPTLVYGYLFLKQTFPQTERVTSGVSTSDMFKACATPLFIFMVFCMLITASTELGTGQLIGKLLENTGIAPILVLVYINGLMMLGRSNAGVFVHSLSPTGMLLFSAVFSTLGLIGLSYASGLFLTFGAATIFAIGICFFWPTMIGYVAENCAKTGALGMSIIGGAGMLSVSLVLPILGANLDMFAGEIVLRYYALLPLVLIFAFGTLFYLTRKK
ncbi:MAG: MFS transporter [Bacteroidetes bacterium]|nr:MAG: MFS transporter [Bacteroidota bacterium]